jgi:alanine-synthesizing transaminase
LIVINPNNPTGAVYPRVLLEQMVAIAARHRLLLLGDEIYANILYDGARFQPLAEIAGDVPCLSFCGLSKSYLACGYRVGWMSLSGDVAASKAYRDAMQLLAALRVCPNAPVQWAIPAALHGPRTMDQLTAPGGRLHEARRIVLAGVAASPYLDLVDPAGALYAFPRISAERIGAFDDQAFALRLLEEEQVLVALGTSFNAPDHRHFRMTLLPEAAQLREVFVRLERVLQRMAAEGQPTAGLAAATSA